MQYILLWKRDSYLGSSNYVPGILLDPEGTEVHKGDMVPALREFI